MAQTSVNERIKFLINHLGVSTRRFSDIVEEAYSNMNNYVSERQSMPPASLLEKILLHFESVNPKWLVIGEGEPFIGDAPTPPIAITNKKNKGPVQNNTGDNNTITNNVKLEDCKRDLASTKKDVEHLQAQLAAKDDVIASKDAVIALQAETLSLLRGGYTRPN
jgi:hypothetical protein